MLWGWVDGSAQRLALPLDEAVDEMRTRTIHLGRTLLSACSHESLARTLTWESMASGLFDRTLLFDTDFVLGQDRAFQQHCARRAGELGGLVPRPYSWSLLFDESFYLRTYGPSGLSRRESSYLHWLESGAESGIAGSAQCVPRRLGRKASLLPFLLAPAAEVVALFEMSKYSADVILATYQALKGQ